MPDMGPEGVFVYRSIVQGNGPGARQGLLGTITSRIKGIQTLKEDNKLCFLKGIICLERR